MRLFEITETNRWDKVLKDNYAIADYIETTSSDSVDYELMLDFFNGCFATLKEINIENIKPGNKDHNQGNASKTKKYLKMSPNTMPPIVIENDTIVDGHHRFRVAKKLGLKTINAYIVEEGKPKLFEIFDNKEAEDADDRTKQVKDLLMYLKMRGIKSVPTNNVVKELQKKGIVVDFQEIYDILKDSDIAADVSQDEITFNTKDEIAPTDKKDVNLSRETVKAMADSARRRREKQ